MAKVSRGEWQRGLRGRAQVVYCTCSGQQVGQHLSPRTGRCSHQALETFNFRRFRCGGYGQTAVCAPGADASPCTASHAQKQDSTSAITSQMSDQVRPQVFYSNRQSRFPTALTCCGLES